MGACSSVNSKKVINQDLDFKSYKNKNQEKQSETKNFEIKAKLWEIIEINKKTTKTLLSKYLFLKPNGTFETKVYKKKTGEEISIDGFINIKGELNLNYKEKNSSRMKIFKGTAGFKEDIGIEIKGTIHEKLTEKEHPVLLKETFILDFTNTPWHVEYSNNDKNFVCNLFGKFKNRKAFKGFAYDDKGYSMWAGIQKDGNIVSLVQEYIDSDHIKTSKNVVYTYNGTLDEISTPVIEGEVHNIEFSKPVNFKIKMLKNSSLKMK